MRQISALFGVLSLWGPVGLADAPLSPSWLEQAVFYQIYPQTFADSSGDGVAICAESCRSCRIFATSE